MFPLAGLKEELDGVLFRCHGEIGANKAALYLAADAPAENSFELVSHFGHDRGAPPANTDASDRFVAQLLRKRAAFYVNGTPNELEYMEILGRGSERQLRERLPILLVPLYRGRVVGYFEMQEKNDRTLFSSSDLEKAKRIAAAIIDSFVDRGLYGMAPRAAAPAVNVVPLRPERKKERSPREFSAAAKEAIEKARVAIAREASAAHTPPAGLAEEQIAAVKSILPAVLSLPASSLASLISYGPSGHMQLMAARSAVTQPALQLFHAKVAAWLHKRREDTRIPEPTVMQPFGNSGPIIQPAHIAAVLSAPVSACGIPGIVLSVAFESTPEPKTHRQLEIFLHEIERALEQAASVRELQMTRSKIAEKLLEPEFESYPDLRAHCRNVAALAERFAHELRLPSSERENLRLAALVHDVGLRPLDYRHLANETNLPEDDLQVIRGHAVIGAAMIAPVLGWPVANIVLAHQEHFDGSGYPYGLSGERIPATARMLHLCDAWIAMTMAKPYRQPRSREDALGEIERGAGTQFDPEMAARFRAMIVAER